ncbi:MAG TPA: hypothetical protein VNZ04_11850 [Trinickia sp.]|jgi:hypothetical protein|nr:hypothetical protein [Trinickia sp.]
MNIIEMATQAGLQVLLNARIGSQTYHSISGSLPALQRFADAVRAETLGESIEHAKSQNCEATDTAGRDSAYSAKGRRLRAEVG